MRQILLVEDDPGIAKSLSSALKLQGYGVSLQGSLRDARVALRNGKFDLILLDVNLPDGSGFDLCKELREDASPVPILMLTAKVDEASAVRGLSVGANDYIRKPVGTEELGARIRQYLRDRQGVIKFGDLVLDLDGHSAQFAGAPVSLTPREFAILSLIAGRQGELITRESLLMKLDREGDLEDRTLDSHISHLRTKLKKVAGTRLKIAAVYGTGFRLEKE